MANSSSAGGSGVQPGFRLPWKSFADFYSRLAAPLIPSPGDVDAIKRSLPGKAGPVLLLGVTPQLSRIGAQLVAVDNSPKMLAKVWPGDSENAKAILADWTALPFADAAFAAAVGDAPLNAAPSQEEQVVAEVARILGPSGRLIFRAFCSPAQTETLEFIADDVRNGSVGNFHALKWRIAMSLAASRPRYTVAVSDILAAFNAMFPDRLALAQQTGWPIEQIATIDAYVGAEHSLSFPTLNLFLEMVGTRFSEVSIVESHGYPLAERCPTIVCTSPRRV